MSICNVPATGALGFYSEPANEGSVPPHRASRLPNAWVSNETLLAPSGRLRDWQWPRDHGKRPELSSPFRHKHSLYRESWGRTERRSSPTSIFADVDLRRRRSSPTSIFADIDW